MISIGGRTSSSPNIDFSHLKAEAQKCLLKLLDKFEGTKTIIWDDALIGPFEFVASASLLKQHEAIRLHRLSDIGIGFVAKTEYTLFFLRRDFSIAKLVADILQRIDRINLSKTSLVLVPQKCASFEWIIKQKVDLDKLNSIEELPIELFVMDTDILTMENENVYRDMYLNQDYSIVNLIVNSLMKLQDIYGQIPRITGQGKGAKLVHDLLLKRRKAQPKVNQRPIQIQQLILIDRRIDLITPFLTQLTYEGLLDEVFNINHGTITLPAEKFLNEQQKQQQANQDKPNLTKRFELRSSEELFAKLRDCHINSVAGVLKQSAKNLQAEYDECNSEGKTIHEMGKIVKRLNNLKIAKKSQMNHVTIAELVNEQTLQAEFIYTLRIEHELLQEDRSNKSHPDIEVKLLRQENPLQILRLICLQSLINNGLKSKVCDYYKNELLQNYGPQFMAYLLRLEKAELFLNREKYHEIGSFSQLKTKFNLINDNVDECNPNHLSYVYGGYSPISVVVAKTLTQSSNQGQPQWRLSSEILKLLPEPTISYLSPSITTNTNINDNLGNNNLVSGAVAAATMFLSTNSGGPNSSGGTRVRRNSATSSLSSNDEMKTVLVFFIGGCTYAEISALRFLSQQEENNCEYLVATTKIINGRTLLKSLWPWPNDIGLDH